MTTQKSTGKIQAEDIQPVRLASRERLQPEIVKEERAESRSQMDNHLTGRYSKEAALNRPVTSKVEKPEMKP